MPFSPQVQSHAAGTGSGRLAPHSLQNFPLLPFAPQAGQSHVSGSFGAGRGVPHSGQNFVVSPVCPHSGQVHVSAEGCGRLAPHSRQNLPVMPLAPQLQSHVSGVTAAAPAAAVSCISGFIASRVILITPPIAPSATPIPATSPSAPAAPPEIPFFIASMPT